VVDGSGGTPYRADIEIISTRITAVGAVPTGQGVDIDVSGKIITPGFIDVHTHYDGQVTWAERLLPASVHGVTTAVIGNCRVGFAPCRPTEHDTLVHLLAAVLLATMFAASAYAAVIAASGTNPYSAAAKPASAASK
jgi:N-acyl-D-amino-acid deacylase